MDLPEVEQQAGPERAAAAPRKVRTKAETAELKRRLLDELAAGSNVSRASQTIGVNGGTAYSWAKHDQAFAQAFAAARKAKKAR